MIVSKNPATGEVLNQFEPLDPQEITAQIEKAQEAFLEWRALDLEARKLFFQKMIVLLSEHKERYAETISLEMGKRFQEAVVEVEKCGKLCEYYLANAETFLLDHAVQTEHDKSYVTYQPLGVILGVMPWNFPFWQVFRFAVPTLMAGNTVLLKHASNVPQTALLIQEIFRAAEFPRHAFINLLMKSDDVAAVIAHPAIQGVSLTGSTHAGREVAKVAADHLKKSVLELGGSDPYIILADADVELAAEQCVKSRILNAGQSCIAAKRFIIHNHVYDAFVAAFKTKFAELTMGDPIESSTTLAPLATESIRNDLHLQVVESINAGAQCTLGGEIPEGAGNFYPATILEEVKPGMPAFDEELFGPVACMIRVADDEEAIRLANQTDFGLGAAIFSQDVEKAEAIAKFELTAGNCFVNSLVKSDPRMPFGGVKQSGYGRELSHFGLLEFTNVKTVCVQ